MGLLDWISKKPKKDSHQHLRGRFEEHKKELSRMLAEVNKEKKIIEVTERVETQGFQVEEESSQRKISKVTDRVETQDFQIEDEPLERELVFFCPLRRAKIYCHSILIDKLGDLTKFIVLSLHRGYNVDEIVGLTKMEASTINEECDYLVRGGLMDDGRSSLTDLGRQYGHLLESFEELSEGIDMDFNPIVERFEPIVENMYTNEIDREYVLHSRDFSVLSRNKDFSNSREIALNKIGEKMPFCDKIRSSLYTTVRITGESQYKCVSLRNFNKCDEEKDSCVRVAIPFDRITYTLKYSEIDTYRSKVETIRALQEYPGLLTKKAKNILNKVVEEEQREPESIDVNAITGQVSRLRKELINPQEIDRTLCYVLDGQEIRIKISDERSDGVYLSELKRERLYLIRFYSYNRMEIKK